MLRHLLIAYPLIAYFEKLQIRSAPVGYAAAHLILAFPVMQYGQHGKKVPFALRSRPVGYAAEYLTRSPFAAIPLGQISTHVYILHIIPYHFWGV